MDKKNLTQAELSAISGIEKATISRWKNLKEGKLPSKSSLTKISNALKCRVGYLRDGSEPMFWPENDPTAQISSISYKEQQGVQKPLSAEPDQTESHYAAQQFRDRCIGLFGPVFEYIADRYGTKDSDIERFKFDFMTAMPDYRLWLYGSEKKKQECDCPGDASKKKAEG